MKEELDTNLSLARLIIESVVVSGGNKPDYSPEYQPLVGAVKRARQGVSTPADTMLMIKHSRLVKYIK